MIFLKAKPNKLLFVICISMSHILWGSNTGLELPEVKLQKAESSELSAATLDNPVNITARILVNASFEDGHLSAWDNAGFQSQNNDSYPGVKDGDFYCEKWVSSNLNLPDASISQTLKDLPNGKYELKMSAGIKKQIAGGDTDLPGAGMCLFANDSRTTVNSIIGDYSVATCVVDGTLSIGVSLNQATGNYAYFDDVELVYYGNSLEAYISTLSPMLSKAKTLLKEEYFYAPLKTDLKRAISLAKRTQKAKSTEEVVEVLDTIRQTVEEVNESTYAYALFSDYLNQLDEAVNVYHRTDLQEYHRTLASAFDAKLWNSREIATELEKKDSLFFTVELEAAAVTDFKIKQRIAIDFVESSFPVEFAQAIVDDNHFISYYDKDKNFCVGYRKLSDTVFQKIILNSKIAWDSHNFIKMIVDNQGYIHISGNMHNVQLNYWRSKRPYDASEFIELHQMVGTEEDNTTYPHFLKTNSGDLLFHYRYGWSGNGYEVYNIWHPESLTWSRFLDIPLIDGEGKQNAYMNGPYYEEDGYYHLYWVWRGTPDAASNHTFFYARSRDMKNWESASGEAVASPIVFSEDKLKVDPSTITYGTGTLNNLPKHALDSQNRIVLCNMKYDAYGNSQLYAYRVREDKTWEEKCITNWLYRFQFGGGGSLVFEINLEGMYYLGDGEIAVNYIHSKYGKGVIILDEETLKPIALRNEERTYPAELDEVTTEAIYAKPLKVWINKKDNFLMRWETMPANNDRKPSGVLSPPYMLELIELEK